MYAGAQCARPRLAQDGDHETHSPAGRDAACPFRLRRRSAARQGARRVRRRPVAVAARPRGPARGRLLEGARDDGRQAPQGARLAKPRPERRYDRRVPKSTAVAPHSPHHNLLLAALPPAEYRALAPALELVPMPLGHVVYESGARQGYVYFPTTRIVSLLYELADGATAEIAVTGRDGLVGIALFMGGETTPSRAVVQSAGHGYRLTA